MQGIKPGFLYKKPLLLTLNYIGIRVSCVSCVDTDQEASVDISSPRQSYITKQNRNNNRHFHCAHVINMHIDHIEV